MVGSHGPVALLNQAFDDFLRHLPGVREGAEEGIHQARVAIRRVREALALVRGRYETKIADSMEGRLRRIAAALGRARDADVAQRLLQDVERRALNVSGATSRLRRMVAAEQLNARRQAIKELEADDPKALHHDLMRHRGRFVRDTFGLGWRPMLRDHIAQRAAGVQEAVTHATGVYFPNRSHHARIAIKQLRYALDLAKETRTWKSPHGTRALKQAQSALGEAHDREVLIGQLDQLSPSSGDEAAALQQFLTADIEA
jgi:CHAD domain-containing protein